MTTPGSTSVLLFVDAIEDGDAWLVLGEKRYLVPRAILPQAASEGTWLRLAVDQPPSEAQNLETRRAQLLQSDPGGNIKL